MVFTGRTDIEKKNPHFYFKDVVPHWFLKFSVPVDSPLMNLKISSLTKCLPSSEMWGRVKPNAQALILKKSCHSIHSKSSVSGGPHPRHSWVILFIRIQWLLNSQ